MIEKRMRMRAVISNAAFSDQKIYVITYDGGSYTGLGFSSYMWDENDIIIGDKSLNNDTNGYVMVYVHSINGDKAVVEPPQCHGVDHQGYAQVSISELYNFTQSDIKW